MWRRLDNRLNSGNACRYQYSGRHVTARQEGSADCDFRTILLSVGYKTLIRRAQDQAIASQKQSK